MKIWFRLVEAFKSYRGDKPNDMRTRTKFFIVKCRSSPISELNYPVTKGMLQIHASLPVSSASVEGSFSTLNLVKTYGRATMGQDQLNGLAKLYIHRALSENHQEIISSVTDIFSRKVKSWAT